MADWAATSPDNSSTYSTVLEKLRDRDFDSASLFLNAPTNPITGMIRYNRSTDLFEEYNGSTWAAIPISVAGGGTNATTASDARTNLGLGTMATQNSNAVNITGGTIAGMTSIASSGNIGASGQFNGSGAGLTSIPNAATTATALNTASAIVARDGSGNFAAGTITANVTGNVSGNAGTATNGVVTTGSYSDPSWITALSASKLTSGSLPDARLSSKVVLTDADGVVILSTQPARKIYRNSDVTLSNNTWTEIRGNTNVFGSSNILSHTSSPNITLYGDSKAGFYLLIGRATFLGGTTGGVRKLIFSTSTSSDLNSIARSEAYAAAGELITLEVTAVVYVTGGASGTYYMMGYQTSGGNLTVYGGDQSNTSITAIKLW